VPFDSQHNTPAEESNVSDKPKPGACSQSLWQLLREAPDGCWSKVLGLIPSKFAFSIAAGIFESSFAQLTYSQLKLSGRSSGLLLSYLGKLALGLFIDYRCWSVESQIGVLR